jgi:hypothetical protein
MGQTLRMLCARLVAAAAAGLCAAFGGACGVALCLAYHTAFPSEEGGYYGSVGEALGVLALCGFLGAVVGVAVGIRVAWAVADRLGASSPAPPSQGPGGLPPGRPSLVRQAAARRPDRGGTAAF